MGRQGPETAPHYAAQSADDAVIEAKQRFDEVMNRIRRARYRCRISKELAERSRDR
jgi:hypothetical protein